VKARVSRETSVVNSLAPSTPPGASAVFGDRLAVAERYAALLAGPGIVRGLLGPREAPRLWERHILNCAVAVDLVPEGASVADVGTGAGLPGIVWAIVRPDVHVTLVEPLLRRISFLEETVVDLGLPNVTVCRGRAEDMAAQMQVDVVTARAVAPLDTLARWTLPLLKSGGVLLALKGQSVADELASAESELTKLGATSCSVQEVGHGIVDPVTRVAVVELGG
jgi:16S rRNA (guanine527-N7)-methyltransferase